MRRARPRARAPPPRARPRPALRPRGEGTREPPTPRRVRRRRRASRRARATRVRVAPCRRQSRPRGSLRATDGPPRGEPGASPASRSASWRRAIARFGRADRASTLLKSTSASARGRPVGASARISSASTRARPTSPALSSAAAATIPRRVCLRRPRPAIGAARAPQLGGDTGCTPDARLGGSLVERVGDLRVRPVRRERQVAGSRDRVVEELTEKPVCRPPRRRPPVPDRGPRRARDA